MSYIRLLRFQTWLGSGPASRPFLLPRLDSLGADDRGPLAILATKRGRAIGCADAVEGEPDIVGAVVQISWRPWLDARHPYLCPHSLWLA